MIVMIQPSALEDNFLCSLKAGHFFYVCNILITGFFQYEELFEDFKFNSKKECLPRCLCRKIGRLIPLQKIQIMKS